MRPGYYVKKEPSEVLDQMPAGYGKKITRLGQVSIGKYQIG